MLTSMLRTADLLVIFPPLVSKNHTEIMIFEQIRVHFLKNEVNKFKDLFIPRAFFLSYDGCWYRS